jgi:hypothetical protein
MKIRIRFTLIVLASLLGLIVAGYLLNSLGLSFRSRVDLRVHLIVVILIKLLLAGCIACLQLYRKFAATAIQVVGTTALLAVMLFVSLLGFFGILRNWKKGYEEYVVERDGVKRIVVVHHEILNIHYSRVVVNVFKYKNWLIQGKLTDKGSGENKMRELCTFYKNGSIPLPDRLCWSFFGGHMSEQGETP